MVMVHDDEANATVCIPTSDVLGGGDLGAIFRDKLSDLFCKADLNDSVLRERVRSKLEKTLNSPLTNLVLKGVTPTARSWVVADNIDNPGAFVIEVTNPIQGSNSAGLAIPLDRRELLKPGFCVRLYVRDAIPKQIGVAGSVLGYLQLPGDEWSRNPWKLSERDQAPSRWLVTQPSSSVCAMMDQTKGVQYLIEQRYLDQPTFELGRWVSMEAGRQFCHEECIAASRKDRFFQSAWLTTPHKKEARTDSCDTVTGEPICNYGACPDRPDEILLTSF